MTKKKSIGTLAVAFVAMLALGTASASADTIRAGGTALATGNQIDGQLSSSTAHFDTSIGDIDCSTSSFLASITTNPAFQVGASDLVFSSCTDSIPLITVASATSTADFGGSAAATSGGNGTLTLNGVEVTVDAGISDCVYSDVNNNIVGQATAGSPSTVAFTNQPVQLTNSGFGCPSSGLFSAEYEITSVDVAGDLTITNP